MPTQRPTYYYAVLWPRGYGYTFIDSEGCRRDGVRPYRFTSQAARDAWVAAGGSKHGKQYREAATEYDRPAGWGLREFRLVAAQTEHAASVGVHYDGSTSKPEHKPAIKPARPARFYAIRWPHGYGCRLTPDDRRAAIEIKAFATIQERDAWVFAGGDSTSPDDFREIVTMTDSNTIPRGWTLADFRILTARTETSKFRIPKPRKRKPAKPCPFVAVRWHNGHDTTTTAPDGSSRADVAPYAFPTIQSRFDWVARGGGITSPDNYRQPIGSTTVPTGWTLAELRRQAEKRQEKAQAQHSQ